MATGYEQRRLNQNLRQPESADAQQDQQILEQLEEGQELSAEQASRVAGQVGNAALASMLTPRMDETAFDGMDQEQDEELEAEVGLAEELGEESELDGGHELETPGFGGGGGNAGGSGDASGDPWDVGRLFGGDDDEDEDDGPTRTGRLAPSPRRSLPSPHDDPFAERPEEALTEAELAPVEELLGPTPPRFGAERLGDACYLAVEPALEDPVRLGRKELHPEDLIDQEGPQDPIGRPSEIGRFLASAAESPRARSVARALAQATAALAPPVGGYAGGVGRLACLAVCAEALEGGGERTDRAVDLALAFEVWPEAVAAARPMAQQGRLHAPEVLDALVGHPAERDPSAGHLPEPGRLGGRALAQVVPQPYVPVVPELRLDALDAVPEADPVLAELDAALAFFATGAEPDHDPDPPLDKALLQPGVHAARFLMNAIGRAHVELAAAALAVWRIRPGAPVRGVLRQADPALLQLARSVLRAGRRLERLAGRRRSAVRQQEADRILGELRVAREALLALREWSFETIAGAVDA
jgi:hypothetical protein